MGFADRRRHRSETHFQLRIKHNDPFYFSEHCAEVTWTNTVHVKKIVLATSMRYTNCSKDALARGKVFIRQG
jgi:hypothetical protein